MNLKAKLINEKLGVDIYNTENNHCLELNKFTKKQIKDLFIDDLITSENLKTTKLRNLTLEILNSITPNQG